MNTYTFLVLFLVLWLLSCQHSLEKPPSLPYQCVEKLDYYPSGPISRRYRVCNDKKDSLMIMYDIKGVKTGELSFRNDLQEGTTTYYYPSGSVKEKQLFKEGKREGLFIIWHENGSKKSEIEFHNDKMNGYFRSWKPDGGLIVESIFVEDSLQSFKHQ